MFVHKQRKLEKQEESPGQHRKEVARREYFCLARCFHKNLLFLHQWHLARPVGVGTDYSSHIYASSSVVSQFDARVDEGRK